MELRVSRLHSQGSNDRPRYAVRFSIRIGYEDENILEIGLPYLTAFWARHGLGKFDGGMHLNREYTKEFDNVEVASTFVTDLVDSCQADLYYRELHREWSKPVPVLVPLTPTPYPSEETGTKTTSSGGSS